MGHGTATQEKLEFVLQLACRLNSARDLNAIEDLLVSEAPRLLSAESANLFLLSDDGAWLDSKVASGSGERIRIDSSQGIAGAVARSGKAEAVDDPQADERFFQGVDELAGCRTRNLLAVPLKSPDRAVSGVLEILNKHAGSFNTEDVALAEAISDQAAVGIQTARLIGKVERARTLLEREKCNFLREIGSRLPGRTIIGSHPRIESLRRMIERVAAVDAAVLITGETGTGKDLIARTLHFAGERAGGPFVALNCAALPEALLEAELFGIEKGVKTGLDRRAGKFEAATGGTLFLDEIGDLSINAQTKILRVLQESSLERVGGAKTIPVDVRLIAATNKNLDAMIGRGTFREDLYARLSVVRLEAPALREIAADIPAIAHIIAERVAREMQRPTPEFDHEALAALAAFGWPGNVRQLENEMRRAVALAKDGRVRAEDLSAEVRGVRSSNVEPPTRRERLTLMQEVERLERDRIREALVRCRYNQLRTAKDLGLSRQGLLNKLKRYCIAAKPEEGRVS